MFAELIRALAAHHALSDAEAMANPVVFLKRANDAHYIIESFATGTLDVKVDVYGNSRFSRKSVEPNTDAATAKEQPLAPASDDSIDRVRHLLKTHGNSAISLSTLIYAGVVTPEEARAAAGLPALAA